MFHKRCITSDRNSRRINCTGERGCGTQRTFSEMFLLEVFLVFFCVNSAHGIFHTLLPDLCFKQVVVDGSETSTVLKNLMSLTEYQVSVFAVYSHTASEGLRGTETTRTYWILPHLWPCIALLRQPFLIWNTAQAVLMDILSQIPIKQSRLLAVLDQAIIAFCRDYIPGGIW